MTRLRLLIFAVALAAGPALSPAEAADVANGKKVYGDKCLRCHGEKGKGDGPKAAALPKKAIDYTDRKKMAEVTDAQLEQVLLDGNPPMPGYRGRLSDRDVDDVIAYIRSFSAR